jgi:REP element-mobilizing transposase RayT
MNTTANRSTRTAAPHPSASQPPPNRPHEPEPSRDLPDDNGSGPMTFSVQIRLADALPPGGIDAWRAEIEDVAARENLEEIEIRRRLARRIEHELNAGHGACWMRRPEIAGMVAECIKASHGRRHRVRAWVVVPNRVHAVVTLDTGADIMAVVRQWKSATARNAAEKLDVDPTGFWDRGAFVRPCRDETDALYRIRDVEFLPVNAGLCQRPRDWQWSSAHLVPGPQRQPGPGSPAERRNRPA